MIETAIGAFTSFFAVLKQDVSVFPLATPLIAGPGAMGAGILLMAEVEGDQTSEMIVSAAQVAVLLITLILLVITIRGLKLFGITGMHVINRIFGVLLSALAVQFMIGGLLRSKLLN